MTNLRNKAINFARTIGVVGLVRLAASPLTVLLTMPFTLVVTGWFWIQTILHGNWRSCHHFNPNAGLSYLFYWTRALNLSRYGRSGHSPYLGLGNYSLARCFHYTLPSLYLYWKASVLVLPLCMTMWITAHLIWVREFDVVWVLAVMGLSLFSTIFYTMAFVCQNYNVVGWVFFPVGIYGLMTGHWIIAGGAWFLASFGSFTVVFLAAILSFMAAILNGSINPVLAAMPACLKLLTHFWPYLVNGEFTNSIFSVMKAIGITNVRAKYRRKKSKQFKFTEAYYLVLCLQFFIAVYCLSGWVPWYFFAGIVILVVNTKFLRFADIQSIYLLMSSLGFATMMFCREPILLVSYYLLVSPMPYFMYGDPRVLDIAPVLKPFEVMPFIEEMERFLAPVQEGERVFMAFENPGGFYENVFDGYRVLLELPHYVATVNRIHFMPDWWGVFEANYEGAPEFWGRDVASAGRNLNYWQADYLVIYQTSGKALESKWSEAGYRVMSSFDWGKICKTQKGDFSLVPGTPPVWWLLGKPE